VRTYPIIDAASPRDRVLIVAPHIDDETIGAAGYAVDALSAGADVFVMFLTAGDSARFSARILHRTLDPTATHFLSVGRTRIGEARRAMSLLGIREDRYFILGYPDRGLRSMLHEPDAVVRSPATHRERVPYETALNPGAPHRLANLLQDMQHVLAVARPTTVIAPVPFDHHPDHSAAAELVDRAVDASNLTPERLGYLVHANELKPLFWNPKRDLLPPPRMRSFTWASYPVSPDGQRLKHEMLKIYRSQRPYTLLLRNAFVRRNELFFAYAPATVHVSRTASSLACASLLSPPSL
jgi:LmbE family N-acetylglucosaminyl deacetylase